MIYKLVKTALQTFMIKVELNNGSTSWIPFDPANTDFANFKKEILADEAQLQDAEGVLMTAEQAKAYVSTLP